MWEKTEVRGRRSDVEGAERIPRAKAPRRRKEDGGVNKEDKKLRRGKR
jgi:hypothetical protein